MPLRGFDAVIKINAFNCDQQMPIDSTHSDPVLCLSRVLCPHIFLHSRLCRSHTCRPFCLSRFFWRGQASHLVESRLSGASPAQIPASALGSHGEWLCLTWSPIRAAGGEVEAAAASPAGPGQRLALASCLLPATALLAVRSLLPGAAPGPPAPARLPAPTEGPSRRCSPGEGGTELERAARGPQGGWPLPANAEANQRQTERQLRRTQEAQRALPMHFGAASQERGDHPGAAGKGALADGPRRNRTLLDPDPGGRGLGSPAQEDQALVFPWRCSPFP